jgi:integrase
MSLISTVDARKKLKPRRDPYWTRIETGCYLGFRKMGSDSVGKWSARSRNEVNGEQRHKSFGTFENLPDHQRYDAAKRDAEAWFKHLGYGGSDIVETVRGACEHYVAYLQGQSKDAAASDVQARFERWVYSDARFAQTELLKLSKAQVRAWRMALKASPVLGQRSGVKVRERSASSLNRDMTALRAALNRALADGRVTCSLAWKEALLPVEGADKKRRIYLDRAQRIDLLDAAEELFPQLKAFLRGLCLVPIRPGALAALDVQNFEKRTRSLLIGKDKANHERTITLPTETAAFFAQQCNGKSPMAPVFDNLYGHHWNKDQWKKPLKKAARAARLPLGVTAYTLRHSVITDLVQTGLDTLTIAQLSGTSVAMIEKHYAHLTREHSQKALAALVI